MTAMEGGQRAAVLLGADYEKVFNHMDHTVCIAKLSFFKRIHRGSEPAVFMYVDDTTDVDIVGVDTATLHLSTRATSAENKNLAIEGDFNVIEERGEGINMKVNALKTQLLIIGPRNGQVNEAVSRPRALPSHTIYFTIMLTHCNYHSLYPAF